MRCTENRLSKLLTLSLRLDVLKNLESPNACITLFLQFNSSLVSLEQILLCKKLANIVVSVDLIKMAILMPEGTIFTMKTKLCSKERFAILIRFPSLLLFL